MKWEKIETAEIQPFNKERWFLDHSERLLLWNGHFVDFGSYQYTKTGRGRWKNSMNFIIHPTHWMNAPDPPDNK